MAPNLFEFATKELSQDAIICWLLAWGDEGCAQEDIHLHELGCTLVRRLLMMHDVQNSEPATVRVHRQLLRVDVVAEIGPDTVILIEDKIHAGLHGDQLVRYLQQLKEKFIGRRVLPVFLKTGDQSSYRDVEQAGYKILLRNDLLGLLRPRRDRISNSIFSDFLANLESREAEIESFATTPVSDWTSKWDPWIGFYKRLKHDVPGLEWDYVPNANGGFLAAWWNIKDWMAPDSAIWSKVYIQIEQGPLCFKIAVGEDETDRGSVRSRWHTQLMRSAQNAEIVINRPSRMGSGATMTVGKIELNDWMARDPSGQMDLPQTIARLQAAAAVLDKAVMSGQE